MKQITNIRKLIKPYLTLVIGLVIVIVIAFFVPWGRVGHQLAGLSLLTWLALALCSVIYYASKTVRFWVMLRALGVTSSFKTVALAYLSAQPVSLLPGGELYRTMNLKRMAGVPVRRSASTVTFQGIIEGVILALGAMIGSVILGQNRLAVGLVVIFLALTIMSLRFGWLSNLDRFASKIPFVPLTGRQFRKFLKDHQLLLRAPHFYWLLLLTIIPVGAGIAIVYISAWAVGSKLGLGDASIAYCLPVILAGFSMLPGGLGASEGGTIGILRLMNVAIPAAVAITLLTRIFTLGASLVIGSLALVVSHFWEPAS